MSDSKPVILGRSPQTAALIAVTMGGCGLVLCPLPIVAIPLSIVGLIAAGIALISALRNQPGDLRRPAIGLLLCLTATTVGFAIAFAPLSDIPQRPIRNSQNEPVKVYIAPPAEGRWLAR